MKENDFGFTFVDETEYETYERSLKDQLSKISTTTDITQKKLDQILGIIAPFLKQLASDPSKIYIKWENRSNKIKEIQDKIDKVLGT